MEYNEPILITGAKGQLGFECARALQDRGFTNVILSDRQSTDITDKKKIQSLIEGKKPKVVFHNAAFVSADDAEKNESIVFQTNVLGTQYIAESCSKIGAKLFFVSSDFVFDGRKKSPYEIDDQRNPLSIYGKSKVAAEDIVKATLKRFFIVRVSGLFGVNGCNFIRKILSFSGQQQPIEVVDDQIGSITSAKELASLFCEMMPTEKYGIYHATNEGFASRFEIAQRINCYLEKPLIIQPTSTEKYAIGRPPMAQRPHNSCLSKASLDKAGFHRLNGWEVALENYLKELVSIGKFPGRFCPEKVRR
jgi:dTDP-4-dehydrorhamnose reductase